MTFYVMMSKIKYQLWKSSQVNISWALWNLGAITRIKGNGQKQHRDELQTKNTECCKAVVADF